MASPGGEELDERVLSGTYNIRIEVAVVGLEHAFAGGHENEHAEEKEEAHGGARANGGAHGQPRTAEAWK